MIIEVHESPEYVPREISDQPTPDLIEATLRSLPWSDITFVDLKIDDRNLIEVSGT